MISTLLFVLFFRLFSSPGKKKAPLKGAKIAAFVLFFCFQLQDFGNCAVQRGVGSFLQAPLACVIHVKVAPAHQAALQMCYYLCKFCRPAGGDGKAPLAAGTVCKNTKTRPLAVSRITAGPTSRRSIFCADFYVYLFIFLPSVPVHHSTGDGDLFMLVGFVSPGH